MKNEATDRGIISQPSKIDGFKAFVYIILVNHIQGSIGEAAWLIQFELVQSRLPLQAIDSKVVPSDHPCFAAFRSLEMFLAIPLADTGGIKWVQ